jgi:hypothetical protein
MFNPVYDYKTTPYFSDNELGTNFHLCIWLNMVLLFILVIMLLVYPLLILILYVCVSG